MDVRLGYKQTEVGMIPEDWSLVSLGSVAETGSGTTPARALASRYYHGGSNPWVKTLDLNNAEIHSTEECVTDIAIHETSLNRYPTGSVLVAMYGGFKQIGRTGLLRIPATVNQALVAIRPNASRLRSEYLLWVLNYRVGYWRSVASSSRKDPNITSGDIRNFPLPLPDVLEQEAIAGALGDADGLIESLEKLLAKQRGLKQAAMQQLLTGKKRLPGSTGEWAEAVFGQMGTCHRGVSYKPDSDLFEYDTTETVRLLRSNNIQQAIIGLEDIQFVTSHRVATEQYLRDGDIVICMANGSRELVGKAARFCVDDGYKYTYGAFMGGFRPNADEYDSHFVHYLFHSDVYRRQIAILLAGSSINNLTPSNVESLSFTIPDDKAEQTAIASVLSDMDAQIGALEAKLGKARRIKQGMMQSLLTGRVRLVAPAGVGA